jgi:nucleoside-diphosphate-sugar epimerase
MTAKHYLVTGGTGFIGSALVKRLLQRGCRVRVLDNQSRGHARRLDAVRRDVEVIDADIRDTDAVCKAAKGVDGLCHLAYVNGTEFFYTMPEVVLDIAVKGMISVIEACLREKVGELILASSSEVYQSPPTIPTPEDVPLVVPDVLNPRYSYGGGKIISELIAINYGRKHIPRVLIFRPHNVFGPDMGWEHVIPQFVLRMRELCKTESGTLRFPIRGTGEETRSFIFVDDCIEGIAVLMEKGIHLGIYHIGTAEERTIAQVARAVGRHFGREIEIVPGPGAVGETPRRCPDVSRLAGLGFAPRVSFEHGLAATARWYDDNADQQPKR